MQGYDAILVMCDCFTKQVHIIPTTKETSSLGLAHLYRDHIWKLHRLPNTVISDHGSQFAAMFMKELNKILGIETKLSMAYHPQTNGQIEPLNQELEQYLQMFMDYYQTNWPEWLVIAKFSYNNKFQSSTWVSPFYANYGYNPHMGFKPQGNVKVQAVKGFVQGPVTRGSLRLLRPAELQTLVGRYLLGVDMEGILRMEYDRKSERQQWGVHRMVFSVSPYLSV